MRVINLLGGPCVGKSTTASGLFFAMKKLGLNVELVTEFAKDLVWERHESLLGDQIYIFAKQNRRLGRLLDHGLDFAITDCPLLTGLLYLNRDLPEAPALERLVLDVFQTYDNANYLLRREHRFNPVGRVGDVQMARQRDADLIALLERHGIPYKVLPASDQAIAAILAEHGLPGDAVASA